MAAQKSRVDSNAMKDLRETFGGFGNRLFQLAYLYKQARSGTISDIYLQDPSFFEPYGEELRAIFSQGLEKTDMVSLHVRRGDYINNPFYIDLNETDYYEEAIAQFPEGTKFLVFCADRQEGSNDESDLEWCKRKFQGPQFEFYQGTNELDDFNSQAGCKAHIIANSSFSWWAAYVGGGKTIAPKKWYADGRPGIPLMANWIVL